MDYNEYKCTKCGHRFYRRRGVCPNCNANLFYKTQKSSSFFDRFKLNIDNLGLSGIIIGIIILLISAYLSHLGYQGYSIIGLFFGGFIPGMMAREFFNSMITIFIFGIINMFLYRQFDNLIVAIVSLLVSSFIIGGITGYLGKIAGEKLIGKRT